MPILMVCCASHIHRRLLFVCTPDFGLSFIKTSYTHNINDLAPSSIWQRSGKILSMIVWLRHVLGWLRSASCAREDLILENLALREQLLARSEENTSELQSRPYLVC